MIRNRTLRLGFLDCLLQASLPLWAQRGTLVIEGATLIDGTGREPLRDAVIVVEGERIKALGPKGQVTAPPGARVIRADGKYVTPGLIDFHVRWKEPGGRAAGSRARIKPRTAASQKTTFSPNWI